ncbi:hypothetical protein ASF43_04490 [Pseudorhodoferax sp. Leaf267]|nr:hypothetical protein ASF43_04490 [Pseudorhodoferax sp. Leaf267]
MPSAVNPLLLALLSILMSVAAQFTLKTGMSSQPVQAMLGTPWGLGKLAGILFNPWVFGGFVLYGLGAVVWLSVLARWDVSKAYPLVGLGFVLTAVVGAALGEQIGGLRAAGIGLICLGVWAVARS